MSGQNTLITCANDIEVKRPSGALISRQFYRDKSAQGFGVYKAMDENGNIEIIGGPGTSAPLFSNQAQAVDDITTSSIVDVVATGMTLTPPAGTYLVWFSGSISETVNEGVSASAFASIYFDGSQIESSEQKGSSGAEGDSFPFNCVAKIITNGAKIIDGRWRVDNVAETGTMHQRNLTILKVS